MESLKPTKNSRISGRVDRTNVWLTRETAFVGEHPSLGDLYDGDLKLHTDFRSVYAVVLDDWLKWTRKRS